MHCWLLLVTVVEVDVGARVDVTSDDIVTVLVVVDVDMEDTVDVVVEVVQP